MRSSDDLCARALAHSLEGTLHGGTQKTHQICTNPRDGLQPLALRGDANYCVSLCFTTMQNERHTDVLKKHSNDGMSR